MVLLLPGGTAAGVAPTAGWCDESFITRVPYPNSGTYTPFARQARRATEPLDPPLPGSSASCPRPFVAAQTSLREERMKRSDASSEGIKIIKSDERALTSQGGIRILRQKRPIKGGLTEVGFAYLVVDCSVSMAGQKLDQAKKGTLNFAKDALAKGYSTGLVQFESVAIHLCEPQRDIEILRQYLRRMEARNTTNMAEAIRLTADNLKDRAGFRVMVIVTDGMPDDEEATLEEAEEAKAHGIDIITIGTDNADEEFLTRLASRNELNIMVPRNQLEQGVSSTTKMLPQYGSNRL